MLTTLEIERRYAEMRAAQFRREAQEYPEGSRERRAALFLAFVNQERAERFGRQERTQKGVFPAA
jgi:hypothetical protein